MRRRVARLVCRLSTLSKVRMDGPSRRKAGCPRAPSGATGCRDASGPPRPSRRAGAGRALCIPEACGKGGQVAPQAVHAFQAACGQCGKSSARGARGGIPTGLRPCRAASLCSPRRGKGGAVARGRFSPGAGCGLTARKREAALRRLPGRSPTWAVRCRSRR